MTTLGIHDVTSLKIERELHPDTPGCPAFAVTRIIIHSSGATYSVNLFSKEPLNVDL